jgi:Mrp family chromosome partitioning ATPase
VIADRQALQRAFAIVPANHDLDAGPVAARLALALARDSHRTVLVDGDQRATASGLLALPEARSDEAAGAGPVPQPKQVSPSLAVVRVASDADVHAGPDSSWGTRVKASNTVTALLNSNQTVLVVAPPLGVATGLDWAMAVPGGVVLVAESGRTTREELEATASQLRRLSRPLLAVVLADRPCSATSEGAGLLRGQPAGDRAEV